MKKHIATVHEGKRSYKCQSCNSKFHSKDGLNRHVITIHEGKKPYTCKICNLTFTQSSNLTVHIARVHEKLKRHKCELCDSVFYAKRDIIRHVSTMHGVKKLNILKKSKDTNIKQQENSKIHNKKSSSGTIKNPYACAVCPESFPDAQSLVNHVQNKHLTI